MKLQLKNFTSWFAENPSSAYVYGPILKAPTGHTYQVNYLKINWINTTKINVFALGARKFAHFCGATNYIHVCVS